MPGIPVCLLVQILVTARLTWELLYTEVRLHFVVLKDSDCQNAMKED